ncbi:serine hydrolase domain-containing protein [Tessaracoccus antarcticus]|uniref:Class C beta-lactamase-related serine hydrolase n=1 Tax=Tessaracoccus antarcticus TaxID=2479848 RepID=A0A3M0GC10_9ACTN|nr:serine hydrolase [Tessaracoccus antarcticus]RMB61898.1 class C beta-lactamase-related serine hydrolase [Tessaracoccus antarcticus]
MMRGHLHHASPEAHGLDSLLILRALTALEDQGLDPHGFAIVRHGRVLASGSWAPWTAEQAGQVYSVSKTFTSVAIGHLVAEGRLAVTDTVDTHLDIPNPAGITVGHLLSMSTGHTDEQLAQMGPPYETATVLSTPPIHQPGTHFAYSSPSSYVLSHLVTAITGQRLTDYLRPRILDPLGIPDRWWTPQGPLDQGYSGLHITLDDLTRLGVALTARGSFDGEQAIPADWVDALALPMVDNSQQNQEAPDWACGYGRQVWMSQHGFRADGAYGQFCLVIPELDMAIAYLGATTNTQATLDVWWRLVESVSDVALHRNPAAEVELSARLDGLDSWRESIEVDANAPAGDPAPRPWRLAARPGGWDLTLGPLTIDVPEGKWLHQVCDVALDDYHQQPGRTDSGRLVLAARGATVDDGVEIHLVVPSSPHRLVVRSVAGELTAAWHTVPLWRPDLTSLAVPSFVVADSDTSPLPE